MKKIINRQKIETLQGQIVWYMSYSSIRQFFLSKSTMATLSLCNFAEGPKGQTQARGWLFPCPLTVWCSSKGWWAGQSAFPEQVGAPGLCLLTCRGARTETRNEWSTEGALRAESSSPITLDSWHCLQDRFLRELCPLWAPSASSYGWRLERGWRERCF